MLRICSVYPGGRVGLALFLLRALIGLVAVIQGWRLFLLDNEPSLFLRGIAVVAVASGLSLLVGFLSPIFCTVIAVAAWTVVVARLPTPDSALWREPLLGISLTLVAAAVVLQGPGAFSADALLFGMRQVVIAREPRDTDS